MERTKDIVNELIEVFNKHQIKKQEILDIVINFMYHLGRTIERKQYSSNEEMLKEYASNPTLGNSLMAQSTWMKDTWTKRENNDTKSK